MNTNTTKTWTVAINTDEVFARCVNESLYQSNRMGGTPDGEPLVIQDDDRAQFDVYLSAAIAELRMLLARYMDEPEMQTNLGLVFKMNVRADHDNNIYPVLINHCYDFVVKKVLEQWYHAEFGSALARLEINHCLQYRKNPVRRRLGPLF